MTTKLNLTQVLRLRNASLWLIPMFLLVLWLASPALPVLAADIVVDPTGVNGVTCGGVGSPCRTIAYAVGARAQSGDTVIVHAGVYTEPVTMKAGVIISGTDVAATVIDGEGVRGPMVTADSNVTASAVLQGLTVRNGTANDGGGIYLGGGAAPVIRDIAVLSNTAQFRGGGIYVAATATPHIERLEIKYNRALSLGASTGGGGVFAGGNLTLTDTCLISNTAGHYGGGVYQILLTGQLTLIRGCLLDNHAIGHSGSNGGGSFVEGNLVLTGTLVTDNTASRGGGGLYVSSAAVLTNATVLSNTAGQWGAGLYQSYFNDYVHITGGRFEANRTITTTDWSRGGALFSSSRAVISGTAVIGNAAYACGGGIYLATSSVLTNVHVISNTAGAGGGIYYTDHTSGVYTGAVRVYGGRIERNRATDDGGGLYSMKSLLLSDTLVLNNIAADLGGGVYVAYTATLYQSQIISNAAGSGGGLYQEQVDGHFDVTEGTFERNTATSGGGGLYVRAGGAFIIQTTVLTNTAGVNGGGLLVVNEGFLQDVTVSGNVAGRNGGGLYQSTPASQVTILRGLFDGNVALAPATNHYGGGGLCVFGEAVITGTQITRNLSAGSGRGGGGVYAENGVRVINALFAGNRATNGAAVYLMGTAGSQELIHTTIVSSTAVSGSAVYVNSGTMGITNTIIVNHTTGVFAMSNAVATIDGVLWYGNTSNTGGAGSIIVDPAYAYTAEPAFAADGYHLTAASPAIDAGVRSGIPVDIDGEARPQSWLYDLGADEYVVNTQILTIATAGTGDGVVTPTVGAHPYNYGVTAELSAAAAPDSTFNGWSGDAGCAGGTIVMDTAKSCTATFTRLEQYLSATKSVNPTTDVLYNGVVTYTIVLSNTGTGQDTNVILTDTLPSDVTFGQWLEHPTSGLVHSGNAITWTGILPASTNVTFVFTATRTGGTGEIVNTAYFSGTLQKGQVAATFAAGSMVCDVQEAQYTFASQSGVAIEITDLGDQLDCLYVDEIGVDHPFATGESGSSGIKTGRYWVIRGLQDDGMTEATGFTVTLTLPHTGLSDPKVCRYTGGGGNGWDCAVDGHDINTVWRTGITSFSEWAVGEAVGPTSVALRQLAAGGSIAGVGLLLALGAFLSLGMDTLKSRLFTGVGRYSRLRRNTS